MSIRAVAELAGRDKRTIRRWIREGKLAAEEFEEGLRVPLDELIRLNLLPGGIPGGPVAEDAGTAIEPLLRARIRELEGQLAEARRRESELLQRLAEAQQNMGLMLRALPAASEEDKASSERTPERRRGWFERLVGLD